MRLLCLTVVFLLIGYFPFKGFSLQCYVCNSANDPGCADPFKPYSIGILNCSFKIPPEHLKEEDRESKVCRKIIQKIEGKTSVIRTCGYLLDPDRDNKVCQRRAGTHDVQMYYCSCTSDLCNFANRTQSQTSILAILSSAILTLIFYQL